MDNKTNNGTHDYTDTINQATGFNDNPHDRAERIAEQRENDLNYEALAVASSMGMLGMDETSANLVQLELAQELMVQMNENDQNEFHIGD